MTAWSDTTLFKWLLGLLVSLGLSGCVPPSGGYSPYTPPSTYPPYTPTANSPMPAVVEFRFDPPQVPYGSPTTLIWRTRNADQVFITRLGAVATNGSRVLTPRPGDVYQITVSNAQGSYSAQTYSSASSAPGGSRPGTPPVGSYGGGGSGPPLMPPPNGGSGPRPVGPPLMPPDNSVWQHSPAGSPIKPVVVSPVVRPVPVRPTATPQQNTGIRPRGTAVAPQPVQQRTIQDANTLRQLDTRQLQQMQQMQQLQNQMTR